MTVRIIDSILTRNDCYNSGRKIQVKGLMLHSVGTPQPKASVFIEKWNKPGVGVCVHGFIEPDGTVYQTLPWDHRGWHAGGTANNTHIGIEMTEPATIRYSGGASWTDLDTERTEKHVLATYNAAVELFAYLCRKYGLNPLGDGVIISHKEGYKRGIASGHADVEHIWDRFDLTMNQFRKDVRSRLSFDEEITEYVEFLNTVRPQIIGDVQKWIRKASEDMDIYWLLRKTVDYIELKG